MRVPAAFICKFAIYALGLRVKTKTVLATKGLPDSDP